MASVLAVACVLVDAATAAAAQETATRYVMADVVRVRAAPEKGAIVVANLRIATPVRVAYDGTAPEGWSKVLLDTDPPLTGYAASAFLGPDAPKADDLMARYDNAMAAGDLDDAKTMAGRLAALEPGKDEHLERLKALHAKLGDTGGALRIDSHLKGGGIKHIGICGGPLLASYQPGGDITPWVWLDGLTEYVNGKREKLPMDFKTVPLPALRIGLQRNPWFVFEPSAGSNRLLPAAYMLGIQTIGANYDNVGVGELASGTTLNLPGCGKTGGVVSNEPMEPVSFGAADPLRAEELMFPGKAKNTEFSRKYSLTAVSARTVDGPRPLLEGRGNFGSADPQLANWTAHIWRLFDAAAGERLAGAGRYGRSDDLSRVGKVTWFKWRGSETRVAIVEFHVSSDASDNGDYVDIVVVEEIGGVRTLRLRLNWAMGD